MSRGPENGDTPVARGVGVQIEPEALEAGALNGGAAVAEPRGVVAVGEAIVDCTYSESATGLAARDGGFAGRVDGRGALTRDLRARGRIVDTP